jgi:hypothetical protein
MGGNAKNFERKILMKNHLRDLRLQETVIQIDYIGIH